MSGIVPPDKPVVFFDGVCGLCNRAVDFILRTDKNSILYVAPLQGVTAQRLLPPQHLKSFDTLVLYSSGSFRIKSEAVFEILKVTQSSWRWLRVFRILPTVFLDWVYDIVAGNRYRWFGKKESCRIPTPEERNRFLD